MAAGGARSGYSLVAPVILAENLGFTVEGTLRNRGIANDGRPHDWWVGGLLRAGGLSA